VAFRILAHVEANKLNTHHCRKLFGEFRLPYSGRSGKQE